MDRKGEMLDLKEKKNLVAVFQFKKSEDLDKCVAWQLLAYQSTIVMLTPLKFKLFVQLFPQQPQGELVLLSF